MKKHEPGTHKMPVKIDEWIIKSPEGIKIIGCGSNMAELVPKIYSEYPDKLKGIEYRVFDKPTKPDYLEMKLVPDLKNIRSGEVKQGIQNELSKADTGKRDKGTIEKASIITRLKSLIGKDRKDEGGDAGHTDDTPTHSVNIGQGGDTSAEAGDTDSYDKQEVRYAETSEDSKYDRRDLAVIKARDELGSELNEFLAETDLLFIVTDLKSKYGLDNSLISSKVARRRNVITVGVVFLPAKLEKLEEVEYGNRILQSFRLNADIVVVVPDIEHVIEGYLVLIITELLGLMTTSGLVNLDIADVKTVVGDGNVAMLGFGSGMGNEQNKIKGAINEVVTSPLLNIDLDGVTRTLVNVVGDSTMTVSEAQKAAKMILERIEPGARLIWGAGIDQKLKGAIKVMVMIGVKPKNILVHIYANS